MAEDTTEVSHSNFDKVRNLFSRILNSQLCGHVIMLIVLNLYGGFSILSTYSLKNMHPVVFATLRAMITAATLVPVCVVVDRNFSFKKPKKSLPSNSIYLDREGQEVVSKPSIGSTVSLLYTKFWNKLPTQKQFKLLCSCGIFLMLNQIFYTTGMFLTSPVIAAVFQPAVAVFTCLFSVLLKREGSSILKFLGVFVAAVGAVSMLLINTLTSGGGSSGSHEISSSTSVGTNGDDWWYGLLGTFCFLANTLSYSFYLITQKTLLDKGIPPVTVTTFAFCTECVFIGVVGAFFFPFFHAKKVTPMGWFGLVYAGIAQGSVSFTLGTYAARLLSPSLISVYSCVNPIIAAMYTFIFLGKLSSPLVLIGVVLITTGVMLVSYARYRENKQKKKEDKKEEPQSIEIIEAKQYSSIVSNSVVSIDLK